MTPSEIASLLTEDPDRSQPYRAKRLGYAYSALEPEIDAATMKEHYARHYFVYLDNLNEAMGSISLQGRETVEKLLHGIDSLPKMSRRRLETIKFNAGGVDNHDVYWDVLNPNNRPSRIPRVLAKALRKRFSNFRNRFLREAMSHRGSGWCWLLLENGKLQISCTENQHSPRLDNCIPLLGCDLWEHAYYLKHRSDRRSYLVDFLRAVNWNRVRERWEAALD